MKKTFPLLFLGAFAVLLAAFAAGVVAQSGRRIVRPAAQPIPPVQAPVFTPPDPEPEAPPAARPKLLALPDSLLRRPLQALDNSSFRLGDFGGKVVVVNLWASWCPPCRREVPEYEKVRQEYADRNVEFIGLTTEDPRTASNRVKEFARKFNFGFRLGWADRETANTISNGSRSVPQTMVIASDGRVVDHWNGYAPGQSGAHLRATIERALESTSGGE